MICPRVSLELGTYVISSCILDILPIFNIKWCIRISIQTYHHSLSMFNNIFIQTEYESRWILVNFLTQQQTHDKNDFYMYQNILYINVYSLLGSSCFHYVIYDVVRVYLQYFNIFYLDFVHWWFFSVYFLLCFSHSLFVIYYVAHIYLYDLNVFNWNLKRMLP